MHTFPPIPGHVRYTDAVATRNRLIAEHRSASQDLERLRGIRPNGTDDEGRPRYMDGELTQAITDDDADRARAALEARKDPGTRREDAVRKQISATVDRIRILNQSLDQANGALMNVLAEDREEIAALLESNSAAAQAEYAAALERAREARESYWKARRLVTWTTAPERPLSLADAPRLHTLAHLSRNGEPLDPAVFWDALAAEITPSEPVRKPLRYEQERYRDVRGGVLVEEGFRSVPVYADDAPDSVQVGLSIGGALVYTDDLEAS